jgi:2-methylcitrate dehydratase PrpD
MNETRTLAEFVARLRYEDLPQAAVDQACRIVVDTVRARARVLARVIANGAPTCTETRAGSLPVRAANGTTGDGIS